MQKRTLFLALTAVVLTQAAADMAMAQNPWNRRVTEIALIPLATNPSMFEVIPVVDVGIAEPTSTPLDLSFELDLIINGTLHATMSQSVLIDPAAGSGCGGPECGSGCGTGAVNGMAASLICRPEGPGNCGCGVPFWAPTFDPEPLTPGDEIMVLLRPSPGAMPEPDPSDDAVMIQHDGSPIVWDVEILSMDLMQTAPGFFDAVLDGHLYFNGMERYVDPTSGTFDMSFEIVASINGVEHSVDTFELDIAPMIGINCFFGDCGGSCATQGTLTLECQTWAPAWCMCGFVLSHTIPNLPLLPNDEIVIILRPVPGALPELPGFEEDPIEEICCPVQGIEESQGVASVATRLGQNRPNPFNPTTTIAFELATDGEVSLRIYDLQGRMVRSLADARRFSAGDWALEWDGTNDAGQSSPSGVYIYALEVDGQSQAKKMILSK